MKPGLAVKGILFGFIVICLIGVAYPRRQGRRHRERSGLNTHVKSDIHQGGQVNHSRGAKERLAAHSPSRNVDKVTLPGNIPVCSGDNCAKSVTSKKKKREKKGRKGKGKKSSSSTSLPEDSSVKTSNSASFLDSIFSLWGNSNKESDSKKELKSGSEEKSDLSKKSDSKTKSDSDSTKVLDSKQKSKSKKARTELLAKSDKLENPILSITEDSVNILSKNKDRKKDNKQNSDDKQKKSGSKKKSKSKKSSKKRRNDLKEDKSSAQRGDSGTSKSENPYTETSENTRYSAKSAALKDEESKIGNGKTKRKRHRKHHKKNKDGESESRKPRKKPVLETGQNKKVSSDKSTDKDQQDAPSKPDIVKSRHGSATSKNGPQSTKSKRLQKERNLSKPAKKRKVNRRKGVDQQPYDYDYDYDNGGYDDYGDDYSDYYDYPMYGRAQWPAQRPVIYRLPPRRLPPGQRVERPGRRRNKPKPDPNVGRNNERYVPIRRRPYRPILVVRRGRRPRPIYDRRQKIRRRKPGKDRNSRKGKDDKKSETEDEKSVIVEHEETPLVTPESARNSNTEKTDTFSSEDKRGKSKEKKARKHRKKNRKTTPLKTTQSTTLKTTTQTTTLKTTQTTTQATTTPTTTTITTTTPSTIPTTTLKNFETISLSDIFSRKVSTNGEVSEAETITLDLKKSKVKGKNFRETLERKAEIVKSDSEKYDDKKKYDGTKDSEKGKKKNDKKSKSKNKSDRKPAKEDDGNRWNARNQSFLERRRQRERDRYRAHEARRLRSKLAHLSEEIMLSLESVLKALRSKVQVAYTRYDNVFNRTRYDIMHGIRDGLYSIVNTNDDIYGIILDMSRLVRHIYRRAHEQHLINPSTRRRKVDQPVKQKDFRLAMRNAQQEYNRVMYTYNKAKQWKRRCGQMKRKKEELKHRLIKIQSNYRLQELHYYSNRTVRKVQNLINYSMARRKLVYLRDTQTMASGLIMDAKEYNRMAYDYITECTLEEWHCNDALRLAKEKVKRAVEISKREKDKPVVQPTLSPRDKAMLRRVIDQANNHARNQQYLKSMVERQVYPLVRLMKAAIEYKQRGQTGGTRPRPQPKPHDKTDAGLVNFLKQITQKIDTALHKLRQRIEFSPSVDCVGSSGSGDDEDGDCVDGEEGSGSGGVFIERPGNVLSSGETDDEDFVFVDRSTDRTSDKKSFEAQLRKKTRSLKEGSELLYKDATEITQRVSELRATSHAMVNSAGAYDQADTLLADWGISRTRYEEIHQRVGVITNSVRKFNRSLQATVIKVDKTVERVLGKVTGSGKGGGAYATVVQKVNEAKSNMASIQKIRSVFPDPCGRVTQLRNNIRTNLTLLRQNIDRFKLITASINIPVSLTGGDYLEIPLKHDRNKTNMESFEFCVKRSSSDGIVAVIPGQDSNSVTIELKGGMLAMSVHGPDGDVLDSVTSPADVVVDKWYKIYLNRYGLKYKLTVQSLATAKANSSQSAIVLDKSNPVQVLPSTLLIGGHPDKKKKKGFTGCISDVRYGGRGVNIYRADNTGLHPPACTSSCSSPSSLVFGGTGYLTFPAAVYSLRGSNTISLYFKTLQPNTLLFLLGSPREDVFLIASIEKGIVVVTMTSNGRTSSQRTVETSYSDGRFYHLQISFSTRGRQLSSVSMDGKTEAFTTENSAEFLSKYNLNYLTLGGVPTTTESYLKRNMSSFSGCMREFKINDKELLISDSQSGEGVSSGTCSVAVVSNCVKFSKKSKTIVLPEYEKGGHSLSFMFLASNPKGYILSYTRGKRLDFSLRLTNKGIEIHNSIADDTELAPVQMDNKWHYINIWSDEDDSRIRIQVDGTDIREISFTKSFWGKVEPDGAVGISLKSPPPDKQGEGFQFEGSIAQLIIDNSPVDLGVYAIPNNLDGCRIDSNSMSAQTTLTEGKVC